MTNSSYLEKKIYYHDTDCGGVVYYANYLKYLEEARTEYLLEKGIELTKLADEHIYFVVARVEIDYKSPARYQEKIGVFTRIEDMRLSAIRFFQEVKRGETTIVKATTTLACIGRDFKTMPVPEELKRKLVN